MNYPKELVYSEAKPEDIAYVKGNSYCNLNTLIAIPTRSMVHVKVIMSWKTLMMPMSSNIGHIFVEGMEVGEARNRAVEMMLSMDKCNYLLFLDDDVIVPEDLLIRLSRACVQEGYDVISGLYHQKDSMRTPLGFHRRASGDGMTTMNRISPEEEWTGEILDVDIVPMGCTLIKKSVFSKLPQPWFKTVESTKNRFSNWTTEDVYFCDKAREQGIKIGIHTGLRCGHIDTSTGIIY